MTADKEPGGLPHGRILWVSLEGADLGQLNGLADEGALESVKELIEGGSSGILNARPPLLPEPLFATMAAGSLPGRHGLVTSLSSRSGASPLALGGGDWTAPPIWDYLRAANLPCHLVNLPGTHPAAGPGVTVSPLFINQACNKRRADMVAMRDVHPEELRPLMLEQIVDPHQIDAATIRLFVPHFEEVDQANDDRLDKTARVIARNLTIHGAACHSLLASEWQFAAIRYTLIDDMAHLVPGASAPPARWLDPHDLRIYGKLVVGACRLADLFLRRLVELAGPGTTVCLTSPHGFQPGTHIPPLQGPAIEHCHSEHSSRGVIILKGPHIRPDALMYGASLVDVGATLLHLAGFRQAPTMTGRVLGEAFTTPIPANTDPPSPAKKDDRPTEAESRLLLDARTLSLSASRLSVLRQTHQGRTQTASGAWPEAVETYQRLLEEAPLCQDYWRGLIQCLFFGGNREEAVRHLALMAESFPEDPSSRLLEGLALYYSGQTTEALALFDRHPPDARREPLWANLLGDVFLQADECEAAHAMFQRLTGAHPELVSAHLGMARASFRLGKYEDCIEAALDAINLDFAQAKGHQLLAQALRQVGNAEQAAQSLKVALHYDPGNPDLHQLLADWKSEKTPWLGDTHRADAEGLRMRSATRPKATLANHPADPSLDGLRKVRPSELPDLQPFGPFPRERTEDLALFTASVPSRATSVLVLRRPIYQGEPSRILVLPRGDTLERDDASTLARALLDHARKESLLPARYWGYVPEGCALESVLMDAGFERSGTMEEFTVDLHVNRSRIHRFEEIGTRRYMPDQAAIRPLQEVSWHAVANLIRRSMPGNEDALGPYGIHAVDRDLSMVACLGGEVVGAFIVQLKNGQPYITFLAVERTIHSRWALGGMFVRSRTAAVDRGLRTWTFHTSPGMFPSMYNITRHVVIEQHRISHSYALQQ